MPVSKVVALEDVADLEDHFRSSGKLNADVGVNPAVLPALISATELYQGKFAQLRVLFDDLLWDGLTMFIARPKAGKSWLTLQLVICVAGGRPVDGIKARECGPVLYLALEEPKARTMTRVRKIASPGDWTANLHFIYDLLALMGGGAEQLAALVTKLRPRLVVVDTLTAIIKGGGKR